MFKVQVIWDVCRTNCLERVSLTNDEYRARFEKAWNVKINPMSGDTQTRTFEKMENGDVKALYIIGENPLMADVHMNHTKKLFEKLDLVNCSRYFLNRNS